MTAFAILKLRMTKSQWNFKGILIDWVAGQGNGVWDFNLSNAIWCSWQENGSRRSMLIYLRGNWPWKRWKHQIPWSDNYKWFEMEYTCKRPKTNRTLGFLRRNLHSCPHKEKEAANKGLVRPVLEYGSSVRDPSDVVLQEELESVQKTQPDSWQEITNMKLGLWLAFLDS